MFDEVTTHTGISFLNGCSSAAGVTANAVRMRTALPDFTDVPELAGCTVVSERLLPEAFSNGPICAACREACALVMVLQATALGFENTEMCSQTLLPLIRAFMFLEELEQMHWMTDLYQILPEVVTSRRAACAVARQQEIASTPLPPGLDTFSAAFSTGVPLRASSVQNAQQGAGPTSQSSKKQVAVLLAATPSMLSTYQPFINLWRCYAIRHGLAFILETDDTEVQRPHQRAPNWLRWLAARRYIEFYAALLVVDPDQFVVPECWNMSIPAILGAWAGSPSRPPPDIATRDFGRPQTLNNGVVLLRSSPRGIFFLDQLLEKGSWMQTIEKDQGAFDETILEILGLEAAARGEKGYDSECSQHVFPNARGNHEVALYALCWWRVSEMLAGPFGARKSTVVRFVDPRIVDVNHVVGARGLAETALLHHFAGRSKNWEGMLHTFGLERRNTGDCRKVFKHVDARAAVHACTPGGPPLVECEPPTLVC